MATRIRHADGTTTAYEAMPLRERKAKNKGKAVKYGLTMDGPFAPTGEPLLEVYLELMQQYEAIERGFAQLPELDERESVLNTFLSDDEFCGFDRGSDAYKDLMPHAARNVRWFVLFEQLADGVKPDNWREWLEPGFYFE